MSFATNTWNGWDYIPRAWPRWIDAPDGVLLVGEVGADGAVDFDGNPLPRGTVVTVVRVAVPARSEAWLEGIRVDPRVRGMDVATDLQVAELHWAAANDARVVRYATGASNEGSHRLGARGGFELIVELTGVSWDPPGANLRGAHGDSGFRPEVQAEARRRRRAMLSSLADEGRVGNAAAVDAVALWHEVIDDPSFSAAARLYEPRSWALEELTEQKFRAHFAAGEVVVHASPEGALAIAILIADVPPAEDAETRLALLVGEAGAAFELVERVRTLCGPEAAIRFRHAVDAPVVAGREQLYRDAGYTFSEWPLHILARAMDDAHPVPALDPTRVILSDPPMTVGR